MTMFPRVGEKRRIDDIGIEDEEAIGSLCRYGRPTVTFESQRCIPEPRAWIWRITLCFNSLDGCHKQGECFGALNDVFRRCISSADSDAMPGRRSADTPPYGRRYIFPIYSLSRPPFPTARPSTTSFAIPSRSVVVFPTVRLVDNVEFRFVFLEQLILTWSADVLHMAAGASRAGPAPSLTTPKIPPKWTRTASIGLVTYRYCKFKLVGGSCVDYSESWKRDRTGRIFCVMSGSRKAWAVSVGHVDPCVMCMVCMLAGRK